MNLLIFFFLAIGLTEVGNALDTINASKDDSIILHGNDNNTDIKLEPHVFVSSNLLINLVNDIGNEKPIIFSNLPYQHLNSFIAPILIEISKFKDQYQYINKTNPSFEETKKFLITYLDKTDNTNLMEMINSTNFLDISCAFEAAIDLFSQRLESMSLAELDLLKVKIPKAVQEVIVRRLFERNNFHILKNSFSAHPHEVAGYPIYCSAINKHGNCLLTGAADGVIKVWNTEHGYGNPIGINILKEHSNFVYCLAFSPNEKYIFSASRDQKIIVWGCLEDYKDISCINTVDVGSAVFSLATTSNGRYIISGDTDNNIKIWDAQLGYDNITLAKTLDEHTNSVCCIAITSDDNYMFSGAKDRFLKIWGMKQGYEKANCLKTLELKSGLRNLILSKNNRYLFAGLQEGSIAMWDLAEGYDKPVCIRMIDNYYHNANFALGQNTDYIFKACNDSTIDKTDMKGIDRNIIDDKIYNEAIYCLNLSHDNKHVVAGTSKGKIHAYSYPELNKHAKNSTLLQQAVLVFQIMQHGPENKFCLNSQSKPTWQDLPVELRDYLNNRVQ